MKLIAGKLNNCNTIYYWDISEFKVIPKIGDYAVVENMSDYDLVKIVGIVETNEKYQKFIAGFKIKKVKMFIEREKIRRD